ncbi:MAG: aminoglycoside 6-adenylyltransferase [Anaerolineales bacterium]
MRSEKEMFDLIINTAREDDRIRAVIMNGSRANPNAPRDIFMDFDIVYLVTDSIPFHKNLEWIKRFGELMILQMPEDMADPPPGADGHFTYLMQFMDGNRIDLGIFPLDMLQEVLQDDLAVLLLDKDGIIPSLDPPSEKGFFPKPPSLKAYADCCNEFWWVSNYVAKGLWRNEILYALFMMNDVIRVQLMKMLTWLVGVDTEFSKNPGKFGKYMQQYLSTEMWDQLLRTYPKAESNNIWQALFTMGDLFRVAAQHVGDHFGYHYPIQDDQRVTAHLHHVQVLPSDAQEIY